MATELKRITHREIRSLPPAPAGLLYFSIGPRCWGKAETAIAALKNAQYNGGTGTYSLHLVNAEAEVDRIDGTLRYNSKAEGIKVGIGFTTIHGY